MDGRVQVPVSEYMRERTGAVHVDTITEPGPARILAESWDSDTTRSILSRVDVSVTRHGSRVVSVVAHVDCSGNPAREEEQLVQLESATRRLSESFPNVTVVGPWVDDSWSVEEVLRLGPSDGAA
jgi:hypothetical protein